MNSSATIIIVPKKAKSYNAHSRQKYQEALAGYARASIVTPLTLDRLYCKVYYFHRKKSGLDADNLSKPVLDALKGVAYLDDSQVVLRISARIALEIDTIEIVPTEATMKEYAELLKLIACEDHILYVEIGELPGFRLDVGIL